MDILSGEPPEGLIRNTAKRKRNTVKINLDALVIRGETTEGGMNLEFTLAYKGWPIMTLPQKVRVGNLDTVTLNGMKIIGSIQID
jgi:hypothetical protein